jgi:molybdate transport system substrate-binding protein
MALGVAGTAGAASPSEHAPTVLLVFAAASLSDALEEVDGAFTARTGVRVSASYAAASSVLAKEIEAGAPRGSRREVLGNALVLIAPADSPLRPDITPGFDLAACAWSVSFPKTLTHPSGIRWR